MNIIASAGALPQSSTGPAGDADASLAKDSLGMSFKDILSETPGQPADEQDATETGDDEGPDATDPMLTVLLPLLQPPLAPAPPPAPTTPTFDGSETTPADFEFSNSAASPAIGNEELVPAGGLAAPEARPAHAADSAAKNSEASSPAIPATTQDAGAIESAAVFNASAPRKSSALPGKDAPAEFAPPAKLLTSESPAQKTQLPQRPTETGAPENHGTAVAMQRRAMPESSNEHHLKSTARPAAGAIAVDTVLPAKLAPAPQKPGTQDQPEPAQAASPAATAIAASPAPVATGNPPDWKQDLGPAEFRAAARFVEQTMELAERVSVRGGERVEVQMRLTDGHEVTVSLHLEKGEWHPVFKTDTDALCHALEQSWQQSAAQPTGRPVRFGTPVFESLQSQTGTGGGMQQQPDARDRSFSRHVPENVPAPGPVRHSKAAAPVRPARLAAAGGVHLYA